MKLKPTDYIPAGIDYHQELKWVVSGLIISTLFSLKYLIALGNEYDRLFQYVHFKRILIEGAKMPDYIDILGSSLIGFFIISLASVGLLGYHYLYHYQDSKSIYLMRRLPNRFELLKRCISLPVAIILTSLVISFLLLLIYYVIYLIATPDICLTPNQWQKIWGFH